VQILEQDETPKPVAPKPVAPAKPKPKPVASKPKPSVEVGPVTVRDGQELDDDDEDSAHDAPSSDVSSPKPIPDGYDPGAARREAIALNNHLKRAGKANYDRRWLQRWQRYAGIDADKIYGGQTRGALIHFGVRDPVPPFYKPFETERYVPPEAR
jgi:outer membrane biosynthesis protein TonB